MFMYYIVSPLKNELSKIYMKFKFLEKGMTELNNMPSIILLTVNLYWKLTHGHP